MKTRADFLRAQRSGARRSQPALGVEICPTPQAASREGALRVGFTATRKIGGAVLRNRAKRRLRAAAAAVLPLYGHEKHDYVFIARAATLTRSYPELVDDMRRAVAAVHVALGRNTDGCAPG